MRVIPSPLVRTRQPKFDVCSSVHPTVIANHNYELRITNYSLKVATGDETQLRAVVLV